MTHLKNILILSMLVLLISNCASSGKHEIKEQKSAITKIHYKKWITTKPLFTARSGNWFDNIAVKDPSIVYYNGNYHLFYTAKGGIITENGITCKTTTTGYACAPTLEELNEAKRFSIDAIVGGQVVAPQIFYFEPQKLWYLIAHTWINGNPHDIEPIYMTNPNIEDPNGWSKVKIIDTHKDFKEFWIDFWVICDEKDAYIFYANQKGSLLYMKSALEDFPNGFRKNEEKICLTQTGNKDGVSWKMFEAAHIYYVKKENKYLALLEANIGHKVRVIFAMVADSLNGKWTRIEDSQNEFLADASTNVYNEDGSKTQLTHVSHPELIRAGYNQKLEIEDFNLKLLYQSFDSSNIPDKHDYNELPWELALMKNYKY